MHAVDQSVHVYNPKNGWLQNCNSTPFTVAGVNSPKKEAYPTYMAPDGENFRSINAVRVLGKQQDYTIDKVIRSGYDTYLTAFEVLVPALLKAYEKSNTTDTALEVPMSLLKSWNFRCDTASVATTLAVEWGQRLLPKINNEEFEGDQVQRTKQFAATAAPQQLLQPFTETINALQNTWGTWQVPWGTINRFQRVSPAVDQVYVDSLTSLPVPFVSSAWGMLPSYTSRYYPGTQKRYGVNGNSFICAVAFGKKVQAKSLLAGGESGNPASPHFFDQSRMYTQGKFKDVLFYKEDVLQHAERTYHPGE
jgi:acyl-homoserine lactone acylase PvdQ